MIVREVVPKPGIATDVAGLFKNPKSLPPKLFYDPKGSALFECITKLPEYYPTRTEAAILRENAGEIAAVVGPLQSVVELGAGSSTKTRALLAALLQAQERLTFFAVDISAVPLRATQAAFRLEFPRLAYVPIITDFSSHLTLPSDIPSPRLMLYLGSSIGNFEPMQAVAFLSRIRRTMQSGDALLLGTDMRKDPAILLPAYDDAKGITAEFNKNILAHINRELDGRFDLTKFRHLARWNDAASRIEIYLESTEPQSIFIGALHANVHFEAGELIHTENSYKYSKGMVQTMFHQAGFVVERVWQDEQAWFADYLARVP